MTYSVTSIATQFVLIDFDQLPSRRVLYCFGNHFILSYIVTSVPRCAGGLPWKSVLISTKSYSASLTEPRARKILRGIPVPEGLLQPGSLKSAAIRYSVSCLIRRRPELIRVLLEELLEELLEQLDFCCQI